MDFNTILQAIGAVGFPIVMCLLLCWFVNKRLGENTEAINKQSETMAQNSEVLRKTSEVLDRVLDKLEGR